MPSRRGLNLDFNIFSIETGLQKRNWPWIVNIPKIPDKMSGGSPWPKISIITPSYNQGKFIEETIRSVLLQGYPNLEYIIIDGGSTDNSLEIIKKYEPWIDYWVSEKDGGQAEAINKGFAKANGEIFAWINSDDMLMPEALHTVAQYFCQYPQIDMIYGTGRILDNSGEVLTDWRSRDFDLKTLLFGNYICQPASFFRSKIFFEVGEIRTDLHYALDYDLWLRFAVNHQIKRIDPILGYDRRQNNSKTILCQV